MIPFPQSKKRYETWLKKALGKEFVPADLAEKNRLMAGNAFVFLRGTYWRWAELSDGLLADLPDAPAVLAVGDIHLENFGTWRDVDGRLVWGVNDFDEAASMPYVLDVARLATSAALATTATRAEIAEQCDAILSGYSDGLTAPSPIVLDRDWAWLRDRVVVPEDVRQKFWKKLMACTTQEAPPRFRKALRGAMPEKGVAFDTARRVAGTGSLGRPRWIAVADWRGAPVVREAKAVLTSAWDWVHHGPNSKTHIGDIAGGRYRSPDPWFRVDKDIVVRRLSPNNRKIEAASIHGRLHGQRMLSAMGFELANIHLGTKSAQTAIARDLKARNANWLPKTVAKATEAVMADYNQFVKT